MRVTLVRPGALGDTLLALPALALLHAAASGTHLTHLTHLTLIARGDALSLARASGLTDAAWPWELPDWGALFDSPGAPRASHSTLAQETLAASDVIVVWAHDPADDLRRRLAELGARRAIIAAPAAPRASDVQHTALWLAETLRPLGVRPPATLAALAEQTPPLRPPAEAVAQAEALRRTLRLPERTLALHPGSGGAAKRWPAARFAEVAAMARAEGYAPLLLAGEADTQALAETQAALAKRGVIAQTAQGLPVATLAALLARCAGYLGCDSGVSHLAALVGAPTLAVFGPSDPARWAPVGLRAQALPPPAGSDWPEASVAWSALRALLSPPSA